MQAWRGNRAPPAMGSLISAVPAQRLGEQRFIAIGAVEGGDPNRRLDAAWREAADNQCQSGVGARKACLP